MCDSALNKNEVSLKIKFYQEFLNNFEGIILITDLSGKIIDISKKTLQLLSVHDKKNIVGEKVFQFISAQDSEDFQKCFNKIKKRELKKEHRFHLYKNKNTLLNGNVNFSYIKDKSGQLEYIIMMVTDLCEKKAEEQNGESIEDELKRSQEMLKLVINNIPQYIFWKNIDGEFLGCNKNFAKAAGFESSEELIGKTDFDLPWKASEAESFFETDRLVMETGIPEYNIIEQQSMASGRQAWLNINKIPLNDPSGKVVGLLGTYEDITERIKNQNRIKRSERRYKRAYNRAEFYKDVFTHDISNILQSLLSSIELCKLHLDQVKEQKDSREIMDLMVEQINRGAILVENIKKLSRIDEEKIIKKINLNHILNEAVSYIKRRYNEKKINITIDTKENNLHGLGNNFLIDVFKNLFRNSVKYNNNPNTEIKIEFEEILEDSNHLLKIDVIDNGIGIPKAQKQAIIQEKIGEHKSLKRIGLGLALVKKILTNMGGSFYISNRIKENPSKGTKFTILVPKA